MLSGRYRSACRKLSSFAVLPSMPVRNSEYSTRYGLEYMKIPGGSLPNNERCGRAESVALSTSPHPCSSAKAVQQLPFRLRQDRHLHRLQGLENSRDDLVRIGFRIRPAIFEIAFVAVPDEVHWQSDRSAAIGQSIAELVY